MTRSTIVFAALVGCLCVFASPAAQAAPPVATIGQLSGMVMAVRPDGRPRVLSAASRVEVGDTLVSEAGSYVRVVLDNGSHAVLGPTTTLKVASFSPQETTLVLVGGQVQVSGAPGQPPGHRFTLQAGETTIAAGAASFTASYSAPQELAVARRQAYLRSSLAAATALQATDGADNLPLREVIAQLNRPPQPGLGGALRPGLHVFVTDGAIILSNTGGSLTFSTGQFGYVRSSTMPPVVVPAHPALQFTPPPVFSQSGQGTTNSKAETVDCEVR